MPYDRITELPDQVRKFLSKPAQLIYKEAFNYTWSHYDDLQEWREEFATGVPVAELAHNAAWKKVKRICEQLYRNG